VGDKTEQVQGSSPNSKEPLRRRRHTPQTDWWKAVCPWSCTVVNLFAFHLRWDSTCHPPPYHGHVSEQINQPTPNWPWTCTPTLQNRSLELQLFCDLYLNSGLIFCCLSNASTHTHVDWFPLSTVAFFWTFKHCQIMF